jgi:ABC-type anion transport system duplicated permease subunit
VVADQVHLADPVHLVQVAQVAVCPAHRDPACRARCDPAGRCVRGSAGLVRVVSVLHDQVAADLVVSVFASQVLADPAHQVAQVVAQQVAGVVAVADLARVDHLVVVSVARSVALGNNLVVRANPKRLGAKSSTTWKPRN